MSWVEWLGNTWPVTDDEAELRVHVWPPNAGCPRQSWDFDLFHGVRTVDSESVKRGCDQWISIQISELHFRKRDWRQLAGLEIRADTQWHTAHEYVGEFGELTRAELTANATRLASVTGETATHENWVAHDFILRFGSRDGWCFPCELDAWMIPKEDYYRKEPETPAEVARFPEGPPNLRVITRASFTGGSVMVPRCGDDPLPTARRYLRQETSCEELLAPRIEWALRASPDHKESVSMPGWTSTVGFSTTPPDEAKGAV